MILHRIDIKSTFIIIAIYALSVAAIFFENSLNVDVGIWPAVLICAIVPFFNIWYGLSLNIFLTPFQFVPSLSKQEMITFFGVRLILLAIACLYKLPMKSIGLKSITPFTWLYFSFVILVMFNNFYDMATYSYWLSLGSIAVFIPIILYVSSTDDLVLCIFYTLLAAISSGIFMIIYDTLFLYLPITEFLTIGSDGPLPTDHLRLGGIHSSPNATAKFLMLAYISSLVFQGARTNLVDKAYSTKQWIFYLLTFLFGWGIAATASKSAFIAMIACTVLLIVVSLWQRYVRKIVYINSSNLALSAAGLFLICFGWSAFLFPPIAEHAAAIWKNQPGFQLRPDFKDLLAEKESDNFLSKFITNYRLGKSTITQVDIAQVDNSSKFNTSTQNDDDLSDKNNSSSNTSSNTATSTARDIKDIDLPTKSQATISSEQSSKKTTEHNHAYKQRKHKKEENVSHESEKPSFNETVTQSVNADTSPQTDNQAVSTNKSDSQDLSLLKSESKVVSVQQDNCGIACTGQRVRIWSASLQVLKRHWLFGIGFAGWKAQLLDLLGFPFDSPHNGLLEVFGEFGLLGVFLYASLIILIIYRFKLFITFDNSCFFYYSYLIILLYNIGLLIIELFEPTRFFSINPSLLTIWVVLVVLDKLSSTLLPEYSLKSQD
jgi:O-Antigen ligase